MNDNDMQCAGGSGWPAAAFAGLVLALAGPHAALAGCAAGLDLDRPDCGAPADLRLNDMQAAGSHNSYKRAIPEPEMALIRSRSPRWGIGLDYAHPPLGQQLDLGLRQFEIDVVYDPQGGLYAHPMLPALTAGKPGSEPYDPEGMSAPGFKVLHVPDVDVRSHCATFVRCLTRIRVWSDAHPGHAPIMLLLNAKDGAPAAPGGVTPIPFDAAAFDALDAEIRSVFGPGKLITPDVVRGRAPTLRQAVLAGGWPSLDAARGKVFFVLDESPEKVRLYARGHASLEGLVAFVNSIDESADHAAYFTLNDPLGQMDRIRTDVKAGFLVRTRADSDTREARTNDTRRREAAFASGAQYVSTDYEVPRPDFGPYQVKLSGGPVVRCNPVRRDAACRPLDGR
ncbi:MAG: phosphatidylinositol-specific phospholipase C1-like protein [Caulobacteraceae bacterium]